MRCAISKRFTDTNKWNKRWYRELSPEEKCFWGYVTDTCSNVGIWEVDFGTASHFIGTVINEETIREKFEKQFHELDGGKRWFIKDFIVFQYGENLNAKNKAHIPVIKTLRDYRLIDENNNFVHDKVPTSTRKVVKIDETSELAEKITTNSGGPTLDEVIAEFKGRLIPDYQTHAENFYSYYAGQNWETARGASVKNNWPAKIIGWMNNQKQLNYENTQRNGNQHKQLDRGAINDDKYKSELSTIRKTSD